MSSSFLLAWLAIVPLHYLGQPWSRKASIHIAIQCDPFPYKNYLRRHSTSQTSTHRDELAPGTTKHQNLLPITAGYSLRRLHISRAVRAMQSVDELGPVFRQIYNRNEARGPDFDISTCVTTCKDSNCCPESDCSCQNCSTSWAECEFNNRLWDFDLSLPRSRRRSYLGEEAV